MPEMIDYERFIEVVMSSKTADSAARRLRMNREAVLQRLRRWRAIGVKGLPNFARKQRRMNAAELQALVNKYRKSR